MHEIGMLEQAAKTATKVAEENGIDRVKSITIEVGELSGAMPEIFTEYFPIVAEAFPVLQGAELKLITLPCRGLCLDCNALYRINLFEGRCPRCGSQAKKVLGGNQITIKEIGY